MNWSIEQRAIFEHFKSGTGNLVIEAFAGTGKTTTITEAFNHAPESRILYAVFNKRNQKEAEEKIQDHRVEVKTLHALGFSFIKRVWPNAKPDDQVEYDRINETLKELPQLAQDKEFVGNVIQLVSFLKNSCINPTEQDARQIAEQRGLLFDESYLDNRMIESALKVMELSKIRDKQGRISFNDMVWLPVACGFARPWFDLVCVDECFVGDTPILLDDGRTKTISEIVEKKLPVKVLTYDTKTGKQLSKVISDWKKIPLQKKTVRLKIQQISKGLGLLACRVRYGKRSLVCTEDHRIFRNDIREWVHAKDLKAGDIVQVESTAPRDRSYNAKYAHSIIGKNKLAKSAMSRPMPEFSGGKFQNNRGGNGKLSEPQKLLLELLGDDWIAEHPIMVSAVDKINRQRHYCVDIANPSCKIAIECDGNSHLRPKARARDAIRDQLIIDEGWTVIRFRNYDIIRNLDKISAELKSMQCPVDAVVLENEEHEVKDTYVYDITVPDTHCYYAHGILVHNCQDMNMPQLMMARQACKPGGRVVVVGDSRQAIYGFRGAVQNGMQMMKVTLKAKTLMLSTTYRCPKAVVKIASEIVPDYKAADTAPDGIVQHVSSADNATIGSAILSRLNAQLMPLALSFLRRNIPARIEGRDIGRQLIGMVRKFKAGDIQGLLGKLKDYEVKQVEKLQDAKNAEKKIEQVRDICETLSCIAESSSSVADCESRLSNLFQDSTDKFAKPAVILSSVHKAKGLEWDKVFVLSETFNRKMKRTDANEEKNIYYVAVTRAKKELYLVNGNAKSPEGSLTPPVEEKRPILETTKPTRGFKLPAPKKKTGCEVNGETVPVAPVEKTGEGPAMADAGVSLAGSNPAIPTTLICNPQVTNFDNSDVPPGQVRYRVGDVILYGGDEFAISRVSASSATAVCLVRKQKTVTNKLTDESKTFEQAPREIRISTCADKGSIIRRIENFDPNKSGSVRNNKQQNSDDNGENNMAKTKTKTAKPKPEKKEGKIAFIERHLLMKGSDRKTKSQIVDLALKEFPGSNEKTIKNTVQWCASYDLPKKGKKSNHLDEPGDEKPKAKSKGAGASAPKKSKASKPAAKKTPAPAPKAKSKKGDVPGVVASPVPPPRSADSADESPTVEEAVEQPAV